MAEGVYLSSDRGDVDDRLVTASGVRIRDAQLVGSTGVLDWDVQSPTVLKRVVMTQDASNAYSLSTSLGYLTVTSVAAGGNQREAFLFPDSLATSSEIDSIIGPPDDIAPGEGQWGNIHGAHQDDDGLWHAVACWSDTTLAIPTLLNFGAITFSGAGTMNINNFGNNSVTQALDVLRYPKAVLAVRATNVVTITTNSGWLPPVGSTGDFVSNTDATFHITGGTVTAVNQSHRTFSYAQAAGDATDATAGGIWQPATRWSAMPYHLRSRLDVASDGSAVLTGMCYRPEEGVPDWTDATRATSYALSGGSPAFVAGEGFCGYWTAHCTTNVLRFGRTTWRRLN